MTEVEFPLSSANIAQCMAERDAEIGRLRAALERTRPHVRNEIIEECARVAASHTTHAIDDLDLPYAIADAIRALKDKPCA